jgi:hypothetical protein
VVGGSSLFELRSGHCYSRAVACNFGVTWKDCEFDFVNDQWVSQIDMEPGEETFHRAVSAGIKVEGAAKASFVAPLLRKSSRCYAGSDATTGEARVAIIRACRMDKLQAV